MTSRLEGALMVPVELVEALAGGEAGGADAQLAAVGGTGGDLTLETGGEELLMAPAVSTGPFGEPLDGGGHRGCFQRPAQVADIAGWLLRRGGSHQRSPIARS